METIELGKVANIVSGTTRPKVENGTIPIYGGNGILGYTDTSNYSGPMICVGRVGAYCGAISFERKSLWLSDNALGITTRDGADILFLRYLLEALDLNRVHVGAAQPVITQGVLRKLPLRVPSLESQKKIAQVLSNIDDKIATNNKIIETSEKLMREIYDYWFVQFDFPDENGRPYKSSGGEMVYDEILKREIPKGWGVTTLGELYDIYQPGILSAKQCDPDGEYEVHGSNGVIGRYHEYNHEDSEIIISCRGDCGNIHRVMPKTWITGNAMVVKPKTETNQSREYLKNMLGTLGIKNISTGSVQGQITRTNLAPIKIVTPSESVLGRYAKIAKPSSELIITTNLENRKLEEFRDWLLPMLMNGQIKVSD